MSLSSRPGIADSTVSPGILVETVVASDAQNAPPISETAQSTPFDIKTRGGASTLAQEAVKERIEHYAALYGVSSKIMNTVVNCESGYNPDARGDHGKSRGLVQIHSGYHPQISDKMAYDPDFSLDFLAKNLAAGKGSMWTCWRVLQ